MVGMPGARVLVAAVLAITLVGCGQPTPSAGPQFASSRPSGVPAYSFAVHPLYNPAKLIEAYQPLIDYLNAHLTSATLTLEASRDYPDFEAKYTARSPEFLLPNPWETLQATKAGYHVLAMAGDPNDFKGIFIIRRDSGLKVLADLKGKTVSYPSKTALAACIMPQYYLLQNGVDPMRDVTSAFVGSQESSIMNAYLGKSAAGATWPPPWRTFQKDHPAEAAQLMVAWTTPPSSVSNSVMGRDDMPTQLVGQIRDLLLGLKDAPGGAAVLAGMETAQFYPADDGTYASLQAYIDTFEREVRPVAGP